MGKFIDFETEDFDNLKNNDLKRVADYWQRQYLLKKSKKNGYGQIYCPIKKQFYNRNKMQAAHYIDRAKMCVRYHEDNVWLISSQSNTWDAQKQVEGYKSLHHKEYEEYLIQKIGKKRLKNLFELSKEYCIFDRQDYIDVINKFKNA